MENRKPKNRSPYSTGGTAEIRCCNSWPSVVQQAQSTLISRLSEVGPHDAPERCRASGCENTHLVVLKASEEVFCFFVPVVGGEDVDDTEVVDHRLVLVLVVGCPDTTVILIEHKVPSLRCLLPWQLVGVLRQSLRVGLFDGSTQDGCILLEISSMRRPSANLAPSVRLEVRQSDQSLMSSSAHRAFQSQSLT